MLPLEPLRAVRAVSMTSPRTEDTGTCTPPDVVASAWSRQTPSACRNAGRIQQVHGGEGQACSGPLDGGNAAPPISVSTKTLSSLPDDMQRCVRFIAVCSKGCR